MKKHISSCFVLLLLCTFFLKANAQVDYGIDYYRNGENEIIRKGIYSDVEGSPLFYDGWLAGKVTTTNGKVYNNVKLSYNCYEDQLTFIYENGDTPQKFQEQVRSFVLYTPTEITFACNYPPIDKQTTSSFYQVLSANSKAAMLKRSTKILNITKNYNATETKKFQDYKIYYIYIDGKMLNVSKGKDAIFNALSSKKEQLQVFAKQNNINFKKDEDLAKLFDYYLSI